MSRRAELACEEDIKRRFESAGNLVPYRDPSTWEGKNYRVLVSVPGQSLDELTTSVFPIFKGCFFVAHVFAPQPRAQRAYSMPHKTLTLLPLTSSGASTLDHDQGPEASHLPPYPRAVCRLDDFSSIFIRLGHLFIHRRPAGSANEYSLVLHLPHQVTALCCLFCPPPAHLAPGPMRAGAEGLAHRPFGAGQHEGVTTHIPRYQYRLARRAVTLGQLRIPGTKRAGGSLAMHQHLAATVLLELCVVVRKVIQNTQTMLFRTEPSHLKSPSGKVRDKLPVREREIGRAGHSSEVSLPLRALYRGRGELPVPELDAVSRRYLYKALYIILADLVSEAARAAVDQYSDLPERETKSLGSLLVVDLVHVLHLEEVVAGPQGAEL